MFLKIVYIQSTNVLRFTSSNNIDVQYIQLMIYIIYITVIFTYSTQGLTLTSP